MCHQDSVLAIQKLAGFDCVFLNPRKTGVCEYLEFRGSQLSYKLCCILPSIYDNSPRNLTKCWVILATENLLTTKVTCEFLVNTVLPLMCC